MTDADYNEIARAAGLERVGARPPLGAYLRELWRWRAFAFTLARFRVEATLVENRLGLGWVVLRPILQTALFGLVFGIIMPRSSRPENFLPFLVVGVFIFGLFSDSFSDGARSITSNASLVRSMAFPRILLPVASALEQFIEFLPSMGVMAVIVVAFGEPVLWTWLLVPPTLLLMTCFNLGVALIAARVTVHVRDVTQVIPLLTRLVFYLSGIFYSLELVLANRPRLLGIAQLNPVHDFITLVRNEVLGGGALAGKALAVSAVASVTVLVLGIVFFWQAEERYGLD